MQQLIRGRVLGFHADPHDTQDNHRYIEDGAILVEDGLLRAVGDYASLREPGLTEMLERGGLRLRPRSPLLGAAHDVLVAVGADRAGPGRAA